MGQEGTVSEIEPGLRVVLAPNPSPMTFSGTMTYLVGAGSDIAVIDPGPDIPAHRQAILATLGPGQRISAILVTHAHLDHSPCAAPLAAITGAPVMAFGRHDAGRSARMRTLAAEGYAGGGEGIDNTFAPDVVLADHARVSGDGWDLVAHWTPGHMANHLSFHWPARDLVFCGDLIMGWASSLISPPDGDLAQFYAALTRIEDLLPRRLLPGHGAPIDDPAARIAWLRAHREARTEALRKALSAAGAQGALLSELTAAIYTDVDPKMWPAAARNLFANLIWLVDEGAATARPTLSDSARFHLM